MEDDDVEEDSDTVLRKYEDIQENICDEKENSSPMQNYGTLKKPL